MKLFEKPGKEFTEQTVKIAVEAARAQGIKHIVATSSTGFTAEFLREYAGEFEIIIVRSTYGSSGLGKTRMSEERAAELADWGMKVVTGAHVLSGAERALSNKFGGVYPVEVVAHTLRMFSEGVKVCVECACMASDCGYVPIDIPIMCIAGTGAGADTAVVLRAANTSFLFNTKIDEIIAKPLKV